MTPSGEVLVVHADDRFVVVEKPSGMLSVPGKGPQKADCVAARVAAMYPGASGPLIVHRLDMETSGLMVLGLDAEAQRDLSGQFETREVEKAYVALVAGLVEGDEGVIDLPMRADLERRPHQIIDHIHGRPSVTRWRVLARETDRTRVEFVPLTGRTHQLRLHAATRRDLGGLGHAILGDVLYGAGGGEGEGGTAGAGERLMLHATRLTFRRPGGGARVAFTSAAPF